MNKLTVDKFDIKNIGAYYDSKKTEIEETESMLYYKTQTFFCKVDVEIPSCVSDSRWTIGLVQACDYMHLANDYNGLGQSLWEFHPLKSRLRTFINDSDGHQYPFYSVNQSLFNISKGLLKQTKVSLLIKDYFHPSLVWELPYLGGVHLTEVNRQQNFVIWLVIMKYGKYPGQKNEITVLKKIRWQYSLHIKIDPFMPLGCRVRKIYDVQNDDIQITDPEFNCKLPIAATYPPHCNAAQSLIWYPKDIRKSPRILVPPKQIIVSWDEWTCHMLGRNIKIKKPHDVLEIDDHSSLF